MNWGLGLEPLLHGTRANCNLLLTSVSVACSPQVDMKLEIQRVNQKINKIEELMTTFLEQVTKHGVAATPALRGPAPPASGQVGCETVKTLPRPTWICSSFHFKDLTIWIRLLKKGQSYQLVSYHSLSFWTVMKCDRIIKIQINSMFNIGDFWLWLPCVASILCMETSAV